MGDIKEPLFKQRLVSQKKYGADVSVLAKPAKQVSSEFVNMERDRKSLFVPLLSSKANSQLEEHSEAASGEPSTVTPPFYTKHDTRR